MNSSDISQLTVHALWLVMLLSLPAVLTAVVVALLTAIAQAVTQIQDQSIGQSARQIAVLLVVMLTAPWIAGELGGFVMRIFNAIGQGHVRL